MKAAFPEIERIRYEGPDSKNPLAFHHYNADEKVGSKTMRDHLRFSVVYWHTFRNPLADPFGPGTAVRPWEDGTDSVENAQNRARVAFEFMAEARQPVLCVPRPRCCPRRSEPGRNESQPRRRGESPQRGAAAHRHQAACGARPTCSAIAATCTAPRPARTARRSRSPPRR